MKTYKIAAMVTHSGKHLETEVAAYTIPEAIALFEEALFVGQELSMEALCELDISEVVQ
jgi:hypothetical protein